VKKTSLFVVVPALVLGLAASAHAGESGWHLRVFAAGFDPDLDVMVPAENPDMVRVTADSDLGFGGSLEYQFGNLLGLELGFFTVSPDITLSADDIPGYGDIVLVDSLSTTATTFDLNFHLTPGNEYFDLSLGAGLAYLSYGALSYDEPDGDTLELTTDNDLGYSAKAGLAISLGRDSNWAAFGGLRYIWSDLDVTQEDTATFNFDAFSFTVGIAYSF
jgi:hypothetical protein